MTLHRLATAAFLALLINAGPLQAQIEADDRTMVLSPYLGVEADLNPASRLRGAVLGLEYAWRRNRLVLTPLDFMVMVPGEGACLRLAAGAAYLYRPRGYAGFLIGASRFDPAGLMISGRITSGEILRLVELEFRLTYQRNDEPTGSSQLLVRFPAWF